MKTYLVGGAVRDKLLGLAPDERDWVVVGATPDDMLAQGYKPVGKDFPVFLHPETGEEYALARTERKSGHGYKGFTFHADKDVTLEQDLSRRDLTINAMALDDNGNLIDPFNGQDDLKNCTLRHVSDAFIEDPLRVLRAARFHARFANRGFVFAESTDKLLREIVRSGELEYLTPERVWRECEKALLTTRPEVFIKTLRRCGGLNVLFPELDNLFGVPNPPKWHPEIDSGEHTLMVLHQAVKLSNSLEVRAAALFHDVGKALTPQKIWPRHFNHGKNGISAIEALAKRYPLSRAIQDLCILVSAHHTACHKMGEANATEIFNLLTHLDAFRRPERLNDFLLVCMADARGRPGHEGDKYPQAQQLRDCLDAANTVDIQEIVKQQTSGKAIGEAIARARKNAIKAFRN